MTALTQWSTLRTLAPGQKPCCFPHALSTNATRRGACAQAHCDQLVKLERMGDFSAESISPTTRGVA
ncbi:hypothetical protein CFBP6600_19360 [Xanthomonas arboricola pv. corylina]|uniref:Uncharacterized protein n=1 Tax=Xanthomonas arboricola pv. corylina TaxID=487821 RepID=A0A8D6V142_9XANT|nr:hypothetical protein CFBP6600_19360 [Xanthomonas arboricola pv. corylina]SUZ37807.1 hypothetical protein CPBF1521_37430 [Xanthomonas arboricola pv. juglandis]CAE6762487.1 hypothetical protein CFBP6600_19360 [Xanthomonas arboricola pv. corylina]CAE6762611.1 hypothetical protein XAC301_19480 [Xanthomonas arboricola pv. corylina]CAE6762629.1 hypothetical protein XAC301_19480 [Xanthomonas arboricola pv. corylina]